MDIHGENAFKSRSYSAAAFNIDKLPERLADLDPGQLSGVRGIGERGPKDQRNWKPGAWKSGRIPAKHTPA